MTKEQIRAAILKATGHPESGPIREFLEAVVEAVAKIDEPEIRETRVTAPAETRAPAPPFVVE